MKRLIRKMLIGVWVSVLVITILLVSVTVTFAGGIVPNTFSPGTTISSSQVNANFQALSNALPAYHIYSQGFGSGTLLPSGSSHVSALTSFSFTAPANGYVILFVNAQMTFNNSDGQAYSSSLSLSLVDTPNSNGGYGGTNMMGIPATTSWNFPMNFTAIVPVSASSTTLYLNGYFFGPSGSSAMITGLYVSMLFIPLHF